MGKTVVVNLTYLLPGHVGGSETVIRNTLPRLAQLKPEWSFIYLTSPENHDTFQDGPNVKRLQTGIRSASRLVRLLWEQFVLPLKARALHADLLLSPAYYGSLFWPRKQAVIIYDMNYRRFPKDFTFFHLIALRILVPLTAWRSKKIITGSRFSQQEIARAVGVPTGKILIAPNGCDHMSDTSVQDAGRSTTSVSPVRLTLPTLDRPYFLTVARWYPHKNLFHVMREFLASPVSSTHQLVIVGSGTLYQEGFAWVAAKNAAGRIVLLDFVPHETLQHLFRDCVALVSPSLYEGFGLPLLEALRLKVPVVCSDLPIHREVTGCYAHVFDAHKEGALADLLNAVATTPELRTKFIEKGYAHALNQTWDRTTRGFATALESAL